MSDTAATAKWTTAIAAVKAEYVRLGERLLDLERLAAQEQTPGQVAKTLLDFWCKAWQIHYHTDRPYSPDGARDMKLFKDKLKEFSAEELRRGMRLYLETDDPFIASLHHPLKLFFSQINRFTTAVASDAGPARRPVGCRHETPCASEVACTRLSVQKRRTVTL